MSPTEQVCAITEEDIFVFAMLVDANTKTLYTNLTCRSPVEPQDGMNYMCVAYVYKLNSILLRAMRSREYASMVAAFKIVYSKLKGNDDIPTRHVLGKE